MNTYDSLEIFHSEKDDIKNDTSIKPKRQILKRKCIRNIHMYKKSPKATHLRVILLEVEPISRLHQSISLKVHHNICTLLENLLHDERSKPHVFKIAFPQGILILVIDQDKVAFRENSRVNRLIILTLEFLFVSLVGQGCIPTLLKI
jgi:hypothetical protein